MNPKLARIFLSLAILCWSATLLYFHASGRIVKYLAPDFRTICLIGGLGLAVLGAFNLLTAGDAADDGHGHEHAPSDLPVPVALLLMLIPLGLSILWTKDDFSYAALARKGMYDAPSPGNTLALATAVPPLTREELEKAHRKTGDGYFEFNLIEIFLATGDREQQGLLDGMKVTTHGKVAADRLSPTRKRLYRLFVTCCAADSRAIPIVLEFGKTPPELPENSWAEVGGTLSFPLENGRLQPVLHVEKIESSSAPGEEHYQRN